MYRVLKYFTDLQDNGYAYNVGDEFPHAGAVASPERLAELSGSENKRGTPLIEKVDEEPLPFTEEDPVEEKPAEKPKARKSRKKG